MLFGLDCGLIDIVAYFIDAFMPALLSMVNVNLKACIRVLYKFLYIIFNLLYIAYILVFPHATLCVYRSVIIGAKIFNILVMLYSVKQLGDDQEKYERRGGCGCR